MDKKHKQFIREGEQMMRWFLICAILIVGAAAIATADEARPIYSRAIDGFIMDNNPVPLDVAEDRISYDGTPAVYYPNLTAVGTKFSVRFTPLQACTLSYIEVVSYQAPGPALIHICSDSSGVPGHDLRPQFTATLNGGITYQRININPRLDIGANQFHVVVEYAQAPPPWVTADNDGATENRSKYKRPTDPSWINLTNDLNFRAYVRYYGADAVPPTITHTWRVLGFSYEGDHPIEATITDAAGVSSAWVHYSLNGISYDSVAMTVVTGNLYRGFIPGQPENTIIRYYISAYDNSPANNRGTYPAAGPSGPLLMTIVRGSELRYDDGTAERFYIVDTAYENNAFAIRMTPTSYPVRVLLARAFVNGDSPMELTINGVTAGQPGNVLPGGEGIEASRGPGHDWIIANWSPGALINSGSFFFLVHWLSDTPDDPAVGLDTNSMSARSYWYNTTSGWNAVTNGEWIMRTVVATQSGIEELGPDGARPAQFELIGNYPNPFNPSTEIKFLAPRAGTVSIDVFNVAGQLVRKVFAGEVEPGVRHVTWDGRDESGRDVGSGVYFYRLSTAERVDTGKMLLVR